MASFMMVLDFAHPLPRYGLAVTLVEDGISIADAPTDPNVLAGLAASSLEMALGEVLVHTRDDPFSEATTKLRYDYYREIDRLDPGRQSGQNSSHGYYLAPHVVASDKTAAGTVQAVRSLLNALQSGEIVGREEALKRSFAPLTAKLNNGSPSLTEPKSSLLEAAFTAIGTLTRAKPGAYVISTSGNYYQSLIPDLPLHDPETGCDPLLDFVRLFRQMQNLDTEEALWLVDVHPEDRKYRRPILHHGNYPNAPGDAVLGPIGLVGAIGAWAREGGSLSERFTWARRVLEYLSANPLYLISYERNVRQAQFGSHVVSLALEHDLPTVLYSLNKTELYGSQAKTWSAKSRDHTWKLFRMMAGRFLQLFTPGSFRDFVAFRGQYHSSLSPIFKEYFMKQTKIAPELVESAQSYGAWLNYVCYEAASQESRRTGATRSPNEYKSRALVQLESLVHSAKTNTALISQLNTSAGRLAGHKASPISHEVDSKSTPFLRAVASGELPLEQAKDLITAFMRVSTYVAKAGSDDAVLPAEDEGRS